jgi:hypothetical protein
MNMQGGNRSQAIKRLKVFVRLRVWAGAQAEVGLETGFGQMISIP